MNSINGRLQSIENEKEELSKVLETRLTEKTEILFTKLNEYIQSSEFREGFCSWSGSSLPENGKTWDETKLNVIKGIEYRFKTLLSHWESEKKICSEIHQQLVDEFLGRFVTV